MADKKTRFTSKVNIRNKRASYEYEFIDKYVAGIMLKGTDIKSIREGLVNLADGYCVFLRMNCSPGTYISVHISKVRNSIMNQPVNENCC